MMKYITLLLTNFIFLSNWGQVVFLETFDEAANSTSGVDNTAGSVAWSTSCPGSIAATDYFKVVGGKLEARDTNSPVATFTTGAIDISSCTGLDISIDIEELGSMEDCSDCGGTGTTCVDFVQLQYNLDGGGWTDVAGTSCPATMTTVPGLVIAEGDLPGLLNYTSPCIDFGSTLQIRVTCMCWAGSEYWRFDNITVSCNDCVLPAEIVDFKAETQTNSIQIQWKTLSESNSDYFTVERSEDGQVFTFLDHVKGAGNSNTTIKYELFDRNRTESEVVYYRLNQYDFDGKMVSTKITSVKNIPSTTLTFYDQQLHLQTKNDPLKEKTLEIYTIQGQLVHSFVITDEYQTIPWNERGVFICTIPEINFRKKLIAE